MLNRPLKALAATLALGAVLAGCGVTPNSLVLGKSTNSQARSTGNWSILTYFALDNDLDNGTGIVKSLHNAIADGKSVNGASFYDGSRNDDTIYMFQSSAGTEPKINRIPEADSGTALALDAFVNFAAQNAPGQRRVLTMADHGGGIVRGICSDFNGPGGKKIIHVPEVAQVLAKNPVDIMMFDACFMQMMEVAYELRKGTKVLIGAQTTTRGDFPYSEIVEILNQDSAADTNTTAKQVLEAIAGNANYEVAFGAVDTTKADEIAKRMNVLSGLLIEKAKDPSLKKSLQAAIRNSMGYANESDPGLAMYNNYRDMVDVMNNLAKVDDPAIQQAASAVTEATKASIIGEKHRKSFFGGLKLDRASGIALYAQVDGPVEMKYLGRTWNKDTRWGDALAQINSSGWAPSVQQDKFPFSFPTRR